MQTVLFVSPMQLGDEVQVREIHERFPVAALDAGVGVAALEISIGSGFYALEITVDDGDGDFQAQFHRFLRTPEIVSFFDELRAYVKHLPTPAETTADMPLATRMLVWERPQGTPQS